MLITVHGSSKGVRISRMYPGGEELITEASLDVRLTAAKLWRLLSGEPPQGHLIVDERLDQLAHDLREHERRMGENIKELQRRLAKLEQAPVATNPPVVSHVKRETV